MFVKEYNTYAEANDILIKLMQKQSSLVSNFIKDNNLKPWTSSEDMREFYNTYPSLDVNYRIEEINYEPEADYEYNQANVKFILIKSYWNEEGKVEIQLIEQSL